MDELQPKPDAMPVELDDVALVKKLNEAYGQIREQVSQVIVGQDDVIELLLITLFCEGHSILEGVPGLAKTLLVSTLAQTLSLSFSRIQFTPDLMPSDITGTEVIEEDKGTGTRTLRFVKGPIFANVLLADEINRTPPKTQSALLEAMQERQVTAAGFPHKLPRPFYVLATQNPIEQEGTYPLPEAQLDRFMMKILVDYPSEEEEFQIVRLTTAPRETQLRRTLSAREIIDLQQVVRRVPCAEHVIRYAMQLVRQTRVHKGDVPTIVKQYVAWGAGPRATQCLVLAGKARAILKGRFYVSTEDVRAVAQPVLRHRLLTNFNAEADGVRADDIIDVLTKNTPSDAGAQMDERMAGRVFAEPQGKGESVGR
ncbi:MAG: MoxR family ATPase [Phycisphaerales bacterium]|nr:MoxR family ATPase [Phycisphaerales bacterium]